MKHLLSVYLVLAAQIVFPLYPQANSQYGEPFDSYRQNISWKREIAILDNFSIYLKQFPDTVGYIGYFVGDKDTVQRVNARAMRAKRYLVVKRQIDEKRIFVVCAGRVDSSRTAFYLVNRDAPPPELSDCEH